MAKLSFFDRIKQLFTTPQDHVALDTQNLARAVKKGDPSKIESAVSNVEKSAGEYYKNEKNKLNKAFESVDKALGDTSVVNTTNTSKPDTDEANRLVQMATDQVRLECEWAGTNAKEDAGLKYRLKELNPKGWDFDASIEHKSQRIQDMQQTIREQKTLEADIKLYNRTNKAITDLEQRIEDRREKMKELIRVQPGKNPAEQVAHAKKNPQVFEKLKDYHASNNTDRKRIAELRSDLANLTKTNPKIEAAQYTQSAFTTPTFKPGSGRGSR